MHFMYFILNTLSYLNWKFYNNNIWFLIKKHCVAMDSTHSVPGTSGLKTSAAKPKKKVASKENPHKAALTAGPPKEIKKTTLDLVCEAIEVLGDKKKGASVKAIKSYIKSKQGTVAANFNSLVNKALTKGFDNGKLERPPHSKDVTGAVGYFRLAKVEAPKRLTKKKKEEHVSDSEVAEKPAKSRKRNLSDTYVAEMRGNLTSTPIPLKISPETSKDAKKSKKVPKKKVIEKDTSDTKILKKTERKVVKSLSDTEVDFEKKKKNVKTTKESVKKVKVDKSKAEKIEATSKAKVKKLYNNLEEKENKTNAKLEKGTSRKKQP